MKITKIFLTVFVSIMLMGCSQSNSADLQKNSTKDKESVEMKTGLYRAELTSKESFYLTAFGNYSAIAYDAKWENKPIDALVYSVYKYEENDWEKIDSGKVPLEENEAWIAVDPNLYSFKISVENGSTGHGHTMDELPAPWSSGFEADTDVVESADIEKNKEFAVVAYRRFNPEANSGKNISIYDFEHPEKVKTDENDEYYMLTFMFE